MKINITSKNFRFDANNKLTWITLFVFITLFETVVAYKAGITHDHKAYVKIWSIANNGLNPYTEINPYGPIMYLFSYLYKIHILAPKFTMLILFKITISMLLIFFFKIEKKFSKRLIFLAIINLNFLSLGIVSFWGLNDTWVASMCGIAFLAYLKGFRKLFIFFITLATLMKIYALAIPFFLCMRSKIDFVRYFMPTLVLSAFGYVITFFQFGKDFLSSAIFVTNRSTSLFSPLEALKQLLVNSCESGRCDSVAKSIVEAPSTALSTRDLILGYSHFSLMIVGTLLVLFFCRIRRLDNFETAVLSLVTLLSLYQAVHPQFFVTWNILYAFLLVEKRQQSVIILQNLFPVFVFMNIFQFLNLFYPNSILFSFLYMYGGLIYFPTFVISVYRSFKKINRVSQIS